MKAMRLPVCLAFEIEHRFQLGRGLDTLNSLGENFSTFVTLYI